MMSRKISTVGLVLVLALVGCGGGNGADEEGPQPEAVSPLADCTGLTESRTRPADRPLPAVTLSCFTGGEQVALADLRGPAVVNLWASWCPPCREELPVLQRYADRAGDQVRVIGVVTQDRRSAAIALAEDLEITFPALDDPQRAAMAGLGGVGLPLTVFVDADGEVRYIHNAPLREDDLARYVEEHLGVVLR